MPRSILLLSAILGALSGCRDEASAGGGVRDQIRVVGSSTIYPFTALVAEEFVRDDSNAKAPVIESTGTGAGIRLFCEGVGARYPDLVDASRRMQPDEYRRCAANGAGALIEVQIGIDGIAFAQARAAAPLALSVAQLYRGLAAAPGGHPNTARSWHDVDPTLPATPIRVYGPPATSGTRDAMAHLILARGCERSDPAMAATRDKAAPPYAARCLKLRDDGAYADAGENDNLIVGKLVHSPEAIGVFGYSYLEENRDAVRGVALDGVAPTYRAIAAGTYPGARPLYLYVKQAHLDAVPGLRRFLQLYARSWSAGGLLARRGLIAAPAAVQARSAAAIASATPLDPRALATDAN